MSQVITISGVTGGVPPLSFFVCDENGNNCTYLGNSGNTYTASTFYSTATTLMIKVVDSLGCMFFKIISCPTGETFFILTEDGLILSTESGDGLVYT